MNILELDSFNLADAVKFNDQLNPRIWQGNKMRPEVREKLLEIAEDFREFLGVDNLDVRDITVSGSNASYHYTPYSDIDLHLVVDVPKLNDDAIFRELFDAKKYQYNDLHNIKIGGYDVELYVEDAGKPPVSQGIFSVLNNDWINIPKKRRATVDDTAVKSKYEDIKHRIESALKDQDFDRIDRLAKKIKAYRQAGLDKHGEFGPENIAFKMLRNHGLIKKLYDARNAARDAELSLNERKKKKKRVKYGFARTWGPVFDFGDGGDGGSEGMAEDATLTPDGVSPSTRMFLSEKDMPTHEEIIRDFLNFAVEKLEINDVPRLRLKKDPAWSIRNKSFGRYDNATGELIVALGNRHIMDILRTLAHELTHRKQDEREDMPPDAGETGSPYENEAHARAGMLMRDYAAMHPEYFEDVPVAESASGYIPKNKKEAQDPRYAMALTVDIKPGQTGREANKMALKTDSQGKPALLIKSANLRESLDQPYPLTWERGESGVDAYTKLPDGTPLEINFSDEYDDEGNEITHVEFHRSHSQNVTGEGDAQRIFATVLAAIQQFIKDERPKRIMFGADKEPGASRAGLYTRLVDRFAKPLGYQVDTREAGTFVFFDLTRRFGLREDELAESLHRELQVFEDQDLFEIKMTGKNLAKLAKDIGDVKVGLEFEMIVPNATVEDDGDMEPDYDQDERVRDIDDAVNFFDDGDYNGHRQLRDLRSAMQESYWEWRSEALDHEWYNGNGFDYFKEWLENNDPFDDEEAEEEARNQLQSEYGDELSPEEFQTMLDAVVEEKRQAYVQEQWDDQSGNFDDARQEYEDEHSDDYSEEDWLRDQGIRYASDVESTFGYVTWPYYTSNSSEGEADIERIALEFMNESGLPYDSVAVSSSYHGSYKKWVGNGWVSVGSNKPDDCFSIEPDGSLDGDNSDDVGLEFVSPPIPLDQVESVMQKVQQWAGRNGVYTGKSNKTSMHTNISVPGYSIENLDYLKAALLLGDEYVLREFDRIGNTYAKPAIEKIKSIVSQRPEKAQELLDKMKSQLNAAASKLIHSGITDKFTSINTKGNRIEFRSPGGDYLSDIADNPRKMTDMINRMVVVMDAALDPNKYKEEYQKKLYKVLTGQQSGREAKSGLKQEPKQDTNDLLNIFSRYAAGELPKAALKSFVRQAQTERKVAKGDMGGEKFWWNVKYNDQRMEVVASNKKEAKQVAAKEWGLTAAQADTITSSAITVLRPYDDSPIKAQVGEPQPVGRQSGPNHNWAIRRRNSGDIVRTFYANDYMTAHRVLQQYKLDHNITDDSLTYGPYNREDQQPAQQSQTPQYELYNHVTDQVIDTFPAQSDEQARTRLRDYINYGEGQTAPGDFAVRRAPVPGSTLDLQRQRAAQAQQPAQQNQGNWGIWIIGNNRFANQPGEYPRGAEVPLYRFPSQEAAESWLEQQRADRPGLRTDIEVREIEPREPLPDLFPELPGTPASQQGSVVNYELYNRLTDEVIDTFPARNDNEAMTRLNDYRQFGAGQSSPDHFGVRRGPGVDNTAQTPDQAQGGLVDVAGEQPATAPRTLTTPGQPQQQFTGEWKVLLPDGREVYRFSGVGNSQADANRVAATWLRNNGMGVSGEGFEVLPVMG